MNGTELVFLILSILLMYTVIPDSFLHRLGIGSWKRHYEPGVVLTFDDGPDPRYTPRLLKILNQHRVKATFFLVGDKAAQHPEIVRAILKEGHQIGAHCQIHRHAWLMGPRKTWREWEKSIATLEQITGTPITLIRPPWGTFNLLTLLWFKSRNLRAVLYSIEGHDWEAHRSPEQIAKRILKKVKEGSIILLHDGGGEPGAPENTLQSLNILIPKIREDKKLPILPLTFPSWTWGHRIAYRLWEKWENYYARTHHITRINATSLFRLSKIQYRGPDLVNEQGEVIAREGDIVGELHFDNTRFQIKQTDPQKIALEALRKVRDALPVLAEYVANSPEYADVKVFLGLTLLNRGAKGLGFNITKVPVSPFLRWVGTLQRIIMRIYHPMGKTHKTNRLGEPQLVWISKEALLERWLPKA